MLTDTKNQIFCIFVAMKIFLSSFRPLVLCHDDDRIINEVFLIPYDAVILHDVFSVLFLQELVGFRDFPEPSYFSA